MNFIRAVGAVLAGIVAAGLLVFAIEMVSSRMYPLPPGVDVNDPTAVASHVANLPAGAFAFVLAAWTAGAFIGVWLATRMARSWVAGVVVAILFLGASFANLYSLPHPTWFWAAAIVLIVVSAAVGLRLGTAARTMRAA